MDYAGAKPNFCSSCGVSVGGPTKKVVEPKQIRPPSIREQMKAKGQRGSVLDEDETDIDYVPDIKGLEYEIAPEAGFGHKIHNFQDVVNVATQEEPREKKQKKRRGRPPKKK